ncbi:MAG: hypothetical protein ACK5Q5_21405 [Planctomycetaceae bacterium]
MIEAGCDGWRDLLTACDRERPVIGGEALRNWPSEQLAELVSSGLLAELPPARTIACSGCFESPFLDVIYTESQTGATRALVACPHCGLNEVPLADLRRWRIERTGLVAWIARSLGLSGRPSESVLERLWRLGRLPHEDAGWTVWLGWRLARRDGIDVVSQARRSQRTLLLVPGRMPRFPVPAGIVCGSLRDLTHWSDGRLEWDEDLLDELLIAEPSTSAAPKQPAPTRRQSRAADIEALVGELKLHVQSARDHAFQTRDTQGVPALLPRPTQKDLARRLGITESRVSRSLNDPAAHQLQLLWNLADDLDQLLRYR